jgi:hypothetical protein|tara:strand:+ start:1382 stop:2011 length:630 start_codon:yes stop_codon:yes gene_type:complete
MKTFREFCEDANIQEFWNPFAKKPKPTASKPKPNPNVLAYKDYKSGVLNKITGKFTQRPHTSDESQRYGWKPKTASSYGPKDTTSQGYNTGSDNVQRTADGTPFAGSTTGVAVPYKYKEGQTPKGVWKGTPSIPFGTNLKITQKPMGTSTKVTNAKVRDTGNFGAAGEVNKSTNFDLMRQTSREVTGNPNLTPTQWGKRKIYVKYPQSN